MDLNPISYEPSHNDLLLYNEEVSYGLPEDNFVTADQQFANQYASSEFNKMTSILVDGGENYGVTAVAFDTIEELVWTGNQGGHVTSYYGPGMQKYTSFQVHMTDEIRCIHPSLAGGILILSPTSLRYQMRRGIPIYTHNSSNMQEMQCLVPMKHAPDTFLIGGHTPNIIELNMSEGRETQMINAGENGCAIMRQHSRFLCCGDPSGQLDLRDPISLKVEHSLETYTGSLSDFDVHGNLLVTCGFSHRQGSLVVDNVLNTYDLRMMRKMQSINVLIDPILLRFMPSFSSRLAVASQSGQLQFVETNTVSDLTVYQVNWDGTALVTAIDVSASSQAVSIGETGGSLHLMSSVHTPIFNPFSRPTEFADEPEALPTTIDMDDPMAIYASIPLPLTGEPLLSDWPEQFIKRRSRRTPSIDPEILKTIKMQGTVRYALNPNTRRRNQIPDTYIRRSDNRTGHSDESTFVAIPKRYRKQDLKYSKVGVDDTDLEQFNKTNYSGLEATLPNSYCNAMLQVLHFTPELKTVMLSHHCDTEFCVCCELGFLFHMLESGAPCHSGNLLRALRSAKEASALRLIISDVNIHDADFVQLIQRWNRFILHQMHSELLEFKRKEVKVIPFVYRDTDFPSIELQNQRKRKEIIEDTTKGETEISRIFGSNVTQVFTCLKCQIMTSKEATLFVHNLVYQNLKGENSFPEVFELSVCGSQVTPAWCDPCHKFQPTLQKTLLKSLPSVLSINCGNENESEKKFWKDQMDAVVQKVLQGAGDTKNTSSAVKLCRYSSGCTRVGCRFKHPHQTTEEVPAADVSSHLYQNNSWVPNSMQIKLFSTGEIQASKYNEDEEDKDEDAIVYIYDLYAVVCFINDEKKNIISIVNVDDLKSKSQWFIFNDFTITPVSSQEAVWFSMDWKIPCVLYWKQRNCVTNLIEKPYSPIGPEVLINVPKCATIIPLTSSEIPTKGDLVAIDAEFVTLNQEEAELRSDGKLATVKPSHMSVARISCVRGQGPLEGTAFIDDYISTQEQVVDYLTKFSGIKPGDLDATCSSKNLTTLKFTYTKLRYLIDNGVIFVGHGLNNDFRVINLVVPPTQVIDTVQLFYLPHQRMVSLRFLAWHFIGIKIQSETHDSIEDARAALRLYKKYLELKEKGILYSSLEEMYNVGKSLMWKVPGGDSGE